MTGLISATDLPEPRCYWTDLDPRRAGNHQAGEISGWETKLKLLLLLKEHVIIAANHAVHPSIAPYLLENPGLLSTGAIVPALRSEIASLEQYESLKGPTYLGADLDSMTDIIVQWDRPATETQFKDKVLTDLLEPNSVLRQNFKTDSQRRLSDLVTAVKSMELMNRSSAKDVGKRILPADDSRTWGFYIDLIYYLSGAIAVRSPGMVPQENLIDYSLANLETHETVLSEMDIFFKVFWEALDHDITGRLLPLDALNSLAIEDILELRREGAFRQFRREYHSLVTDACKTVLGENPDRLHHLQKLVEAAGEVRAAFTEALKLEKCLNERLIRAENVCDFVSHTSTLSLGIAGFFAVSLGIISLLPSAAAVLLSAVTVGGGKELALVHRLRRRRRDLLVRLPPPLGVEDNPVLTEAIRELRHQIASGSD